MPPLISFRGTWNSGGKAGESGGKVAASEQQDKQSPVPSKKVTTSSELQEKQIPAPDKTSKESNSIRAKKTASSKETSSIRDKKAAPSKETSSIHGKKAVSSKETGSTHGKRTSSSKEASSTHGKKTTSSKETSSTHGKKTTSSKETSSIQGGGTQKMNFKIEKPEEVFTNHESLPSMEAAYARFKEMYPEFVKTLVLDDIRAEEYGHLEENGHVCLDYSGYGLFSQFQQKWHKTSTSFGLAYISANLPTHALYGGADEGTAEFDIKSRVINFLNIQESEYSMVFTASRGSAFKLLAESYPFHLNKRLLTVYDYESDAVNWMEETARKKGANVMNACFRWPSQRLWATDLKKKMVEKKKKKETAKGLFVFPVQSRVTGAKYSYQWMSQAQANEWHVLLDASALGPKDMDSLGLSLFRPDFIVSSFYKVYGSDPTGFGCLLIKNSVMLCLHNSSAARGVGMVKIVSLPGISSPNRFSEMGDIEEEPEIQEIKEEDEETTNRELPRKAGPREQLLSTPSFSGPVAPFYRAGNLRQSSTHVAGVKQERVAKSRMGNNPDVGSYAVVDRYEISSPVFSELGREGEDWSVKGKRPLFRPSRTDEASTSEVRENQIDDTGNELSGKPSYSNSTISSDGGNQDEGREGPEEEEEEIPIGRTLGKVIIEEEEEIPIGRTLGKVIIEEEVGRSISRIDLNNNEKTSSRTGIASKMGFPYNGNNGFEGTGDPGKREMSITSSGTGFTGPKVLPQDHENQRSIRLIDQIMEDYASEELELDEAASFDERERSDSESTYGDQRASVFQEGHREVGNVAEEGRYSFDSQSQEEIEVDSFRGSEPISQHGNSPMGRSEGRSASAYYMGSQGDQSFLYSEDAASAFYFEDEENYQTGVADESSMSRKEPEILCRGLDHADTLGLNKTNNRLKCLINWLVSSMLKLHHPGSDDNASRLVQMYGPKVKYDRGASVAFNLFDWKGNLLQPIVVQRLADRSNISLGTATLHHIRFPESYLDWQGFLEPKKNSSVGIPTAEGQVEGGGKSPSIEVVTAALGFMTNFEDVYRLWAFVAKFLDADFVSKEVWRYLSLNQETVVVGIQKPTRSPLP